VRQEGSAATAAAATGAAGCTRTARRRHRRRPRPNRPRRRRRRRSAEDELFARKSLDQLNAEMPLGDVKFDYDKSTVKDDQRAILQKNADWMRRWTTTRVSIEGHADAAAPTNTTSRWAIGAPGRSWTTW
jgi:outer membrane protein OmpA-like peptidoglycan-associated protein